jgi:hypothetical protein
MKSQLEISTMDILQARGASIADPTSPILAQNLSQVSKMLKSSEKE